MPNNSKFEKPWSSNIADGVLKSVALYGVGHYILSAAIIYIACDGQPVFGWITFFPGLMLQILGLVVLYQTVIDDKHFERGRLWKTMLFFLLLVPIVYSFYEVVGTSALWSTFNGCPPL